MLFLGHASRSHMLPDGYRANRYADVSHGGIPESNIHSYGTPKMRNMGPMTANLEENMVACIEVP